MRSQQEPRRIDWTQRFLFFIPIRNRRSRRILVVGYYLFFAVFAAFLLWLKGMKDYDFLLPFTYLFAQMLGGLIGGGPVRLFSQWQRNAIGGAERRGEPPQSLSGYAGSRPAAFVDRLDEHDIARRDRAHYLAYSALRWPAIAAALFSLMFLMKNTPERVAHILLILSVPVALVFFSLPQTMLLWTEADLEPDPVDPGSQTVFKVVS